MHSNQLSRNIVVAVCAMWLLACGRTVQAELILSHNNSVGRTLGGLFFRDGSLVNYSTATDTSVLLLDGDTAGGGDTFSVFRAANGTQTSDENIDAIHIRPDGRVVLSTAGSARLRASGGGVLEFEDGDLVLYDILNDEASMFLRGKDVFRLANGSVGADEEIDAFSILPNGNYLISTNAAARLRSGPGTVLDFSGREVVEYDPVNDLATIFLTATGASSISEMPRTRLAKTGISTPSTRCRMVMYY